MGGASINLAPTSADNTLSTSSNVDRAQSPHLLTPVRWPAREEMWRSRMRIRPLQGAPSVFACLQAPSRRPANSPSSAARRYSQQHAHDHQQQALPLPPVRVLGPLVFSFAAVGTIYFVCAAYEVHQDIKRYKASFPSDTKPPTASERSLGLIRWRIALNDQITDFEDPNRKTVILSLLDPQSGARQVYASLVSINLAAMAPMVTSRSWEESLITRFSHQAAEPYFRYHQLLTSAFLHSGPWHLAVNLLAFQAFSASVDLFHTPSMRSSGSNFLAFCLSGAVVSCFGDHLSTLMPVNRLQRLKFGLGFSGVTSAVVGLTCTVLPNLSYDLILVPGSINADSLLSLIMAFEVAGVFGLVGRFLPSLANTGFAAHMSGLLFGQAIGRWSGEGELWKFFRSKAYHTMRWLEVA